MRLDHRDFQIQAQGLVCHLLVCCFHGLLDPRMPLYPQCNQRLLQTPVSTAQAPTTQPCAAHPLYTRWDQTFMHGFCATCPRLLSYVIEQWFSVGTDLDLQGTCQCLETLLMATMVRKKECNYSLVGRIQGHWETSHFRPMPQTKRLTPQPPSCAKQEILSRRLYSGSKALDHVCSDTGYCNRAISLYTAITQIPKCVPSAPLPSSYLSNSEPSL